MRDATSRMPEVGASQDALELMRRLTGDAALEDRRWADAVLTELARRMDDPAVVYRDLEPALPSDTPGVLLPGGRWHVDLTAIRGRWPELALAALAAVVSRDPLAVAGALVSLRNALTRLTDDEREVVGTLARLGNERDLPVPRPELEAAFAYDPRRDGEMPPGIRPIDAPAIIRELLRRGVLVEKAGALTIRL